MARIKPTPTAPDTMAPNRLVEASEVAALLSVSVRALWRMVSQGTFPPPIRFNCKFVRWRADVVEAWLAHVGGPQQSYLSMEA
jgi:predicted DNA-binding transcriptional regulator AlpA